MYCLYISLRVSLCCQKSVLVSVWSVLSWCVHSCLMSCMLYVVCSGWIGVGLQVIHCFGAYQCLGDGRLELQQPFRIFLCVFALLLSYSFSTPLFLPYFVYLSYFIIFSILVLMSKCLGKHSRMSFTFPLTILNGTCFLHKAKSLFLQLKL